MGLLEDLVAADVAQNSHYTRKIEAHRARKEKEKNDNREFFNSIGVGDIKSLFDCPQKIIEEKKNRNWYAKKALATMFSEGTEIAAAYQKDAKETPGLRAPDPVLDDHLTEIYKERGEIPIRLYSKCGAKLVSGYMDDVQLKGGAISIVEMKTTNVEPEDFKVRFEEKVLKINKKHQMQLKTYMYLVKRNKYWPDHKLADGELVYICARIMSGEEGRTRSVWVKLTKEDELMYDKFFEELEIQLLGSAAGTQIPCNYEYCRDHGKKDD